MAKLNLDTLLRAWHDTTVPSRAEKALAEKFPLQAEANARIERATLHYLAAAAGLIDAYRSHTDLGYSEAHSYLRSVYNSLPTPPAPVVIPESLRLTAAERAALEEGNGDGPADAEEASE